MRNSSLDIYNRWGTLVKNFPVYDNSWDGGSSVDGTYYWIYRKPNGQTVTGFVELIR